MKNTIKKNLKWTVLLVVTLVSLNQTSQNSFDLPRETTKLLKNMTEVNKELRETLSAMVLSN